MKSNSSLLKITSIIGFLSITISLILIINNPASGYEISVYTNKLFLIWIFLIGSIICGIFIIVQQSILVRKKKWIWLLIGFTLIVLSNLIILLMPIFRGYVMYGRWDILTHVGFVLDILQEGFVPKDNIYPIVHIYVAEISYIINRSAITTIVYFIPFFVLQFIFYIYLLSKIVLNNQKKILMSTVTGTVFLFSYLNYQVIPNAFSIIEIPLIFYLYFSTIEKKSVEFNILLIILLISYPFIHPLTSLVLVFGFIIFEIIKLFIEYKIKNEKKISIKKFNVNISLIMVIIYVMWLSHHYYFWEYNIKKVIYWLSGQYSTPSISKGILEVFRILNLNNVDIIMLFLKMYGHILIFLVLTLISIKIILDKISTKNDLKNNFILIGWLLVAGLLALLNLFSTVFNFGIWRLLGMIAIVFPIFAGFALNEIIIKQSSFIKNKKMGRIFIIFILSVSSIIGIMNTYPSPWIFQTNEQVTKMEYSGNIWHYNYKNQIISDNYIKSSFRFADSILGSEQSKKRKDIPRIDRYNTIAGYKLPIGLIPSHFNYSNNSMIGNFYNTEAYLPISKYDKMYYIEFYPQLDEFTQNDFEKMNYDSTVNKLYYNGEFEIRLICPNN